MWWLVFKHVLALICSFSLSFYLVPILAETARKRGLIDEPDNKIKVHKKAVPYLGGLAVYLSFIAVSSLFYSFSGKDSWLILGITFLLFVGLIDDLNQLRPYQKLGGQVIAVLCFLKGGIALRSTFFSQFFNLLGSGFWMLAVINAFNLVDVMDGLATILAAIATLSFFVLSIFTGNYSLSILLLILFGSLVGFFLYNKPPAKIFLGDAGSLCIGGFLATVPLLFPWSKIIFNLSRWPKFVEGNSFFQVCLIAMIPVLLIGIPLLEVSSLIVIRMYHGLPVYDGSPHHFSSYLRKKGWRVRKVLLFTGTKACALSATVLLFVFGFLPFWGLIILLLCFSGIWFWCVFR